MPELATTLAAVRARAYDLAAGNLLGSNLFNMLILVIDDLAYFDGPLLAAADEASARISPSTRRPAASRAREAPSVSRTASSLARVAARASSRLATVGITGDTHMPGVPSGLPEVRLTASKYPLVHHSSGHRKNPRKASRFPAELPAEP